MDRFLLNKERLKKKPVYKYFFSLEELCKPVSAPMSSLGYSSLLVYCFQKTRAIILAPRMVSEK